MLQCSITSSPPPLASSRVCVELIERIMAVLSLDHPWTFAFGMLGNIISFLVYLAPMPTFYRVYKKKSTEGFQSVPYVVALFSAMLWIYYAFVKKDAYLLITINTIGCFIETAYIAMYFKYAPRKAKVYTAKLILCLNVGVFGLILLSTLLLSQGPRRGKILGWVCMCFSISVFVAPLSIIRLVIRTKSVEFMPFFLSFFLTLSAVAWGFYGLLLKDKFIALPNVLGFSFGMIQMVIYVVYKDAKKVVQEPQHAEMGEGCMDVAEKKKNNGEEKKEGVEEEKEVDVNTV